MPPSVYIGVWEDNVFIGAVVFGRGASPKLGAAYGLSNLEVCELTRVALRGHKTPVSRIVAIALKLLRQSSPGLKCVFSFADANEGHHGGIYQAGNWLYLGETSKRTEYVDKKGRNLHSRIVTGSGWCKQFGKMTRVPTPSECRKIHLRGKYRYAMPFDLDLAARLRALSLPFPKRQKVEAGQSPVTKI